MPPQSLISYIQQQLRNGYSISAIRQKLIEYGYPQQQIDEAINTVYQTPASVKHEIHIGKSTIIALIVVFIGLGLIGTAIMLYFNQSAAPKQLLDVNIIPVKGSVQPGETLNFNVELSNLGSGERFDVLLKYEVSHAISDEILTVKEESIAIETRTSVTAEIPIPDSAEPGDYYVRTKAIYGDKTATAAVMFKIYKKTIKPTCYDNIKNQDEEEIDCGGPCKACASCSDRIKNQNEEGIDCGGPCPPCQKCPESCDDTDPCTKDSCSARTNYRCTYTPIVPCCGNYKCESGESPQNCPKDCKEKPIEPVDEGELAGLTLWEKIDKIKEIAASDPEKASSYCHEIEEDLYKDQCFLNIAEATQSVSSCELIIDERTKDKCYTSLAKTLNNYVICEQVIGESRRNSCYMAFVMDGDYTVCEKISNDYLRQSCDALSSLSDEIEKHSDEYEEIPLE